MRLRCWYFNHVQHYTKYILWHCVICRCAAWASTSATDVYVSIQALLKLHSPKTRGRKPQRETTLQVTRGGTSGLGSVVGVLAIDLTRCLCLWRIIWLIVYSYIYTKYLFYLFSHSYLVGEIGATTAAVQILWIYEFYMNVHTGGPVVQMAPNLRYVSQKYYTGEPFCPRASSNGWPLHCCCCRYILRSILIASAIWHAVSKTPFGFGTSIQQFSKSITAARHVIPLWIEWSWYRREYAYVFCCFIFLSIIYNPYIRYEYQVRVSWRILLLLLVQIESNLQKVEPTKP